MSEWAFEHSIFTVATRPDAWAYWTAMDNHAKMEPGVQRIELDGPFATGTTGRTIAEGFTQEWQLDDVIEGERFTVIGFAPGDGGSLSFTWIFEDEADGTRMTHQIRATGPEVENTLEELRQMALHAPKSMARLAGALNRLAERKPRR